MKGESSRQTGDINLASALMACAIPLIRECPVRIIESGSAKPYAAFHLSASSLDGRHVTEKLMTHWTTGTAVQSDHPFSKICEFIKGKPSPKMVIEDWLDYAIDHISNMGIILHGLRNIRDISSFVEKIPSAPESYILAFVANRKVCLDLYHIAKRAVFMSHDESYALIDAKLPAWQRNELLSRLQG